MRPATFHFDGHDYDYARSPAGNERTVEVALALDFVKRYATQESRALEIGHVLRGPNKFAMEVADSFGSYDTLDKFERSPGVLNEDLRTFDRKPYDIVISVSTLEHIGVDEKEDPSEAIIGFAKAWDLMTGIGGFFFTIPTGFNLALERHLVYGGAQMALGAMKRVSQDNEWAEIRPEEAITLPYGRPYKHGNAVLIGSRAPRRMT